MKTSARRLLQVWIACCAILLNALAPAVSHALALQQGQQRSWEICLNDGSRLAGTGELDHATFLALTDRSGAAATPSSPSSPSPHRLMVDCGYCLSHAGALGLPPPAALPLPFTTAQVERPYLFYHAPRPLAPWAAAHPRGPPVDTLLV